MDTGALLAGVSPNLDTSFCRVLAMMTSTTHPEFNRHTEGVEVARAFAEQVRGKTILVTGVNLKGVGFATAQAFASQSPAHLIIAGRNLTRLQESIDALRKEYPDVDYRPLVLDLSNQIAVRAAASDFLTWMDIPELNILVNSAGVANVAERTLSPDGVEIQFATNHLGHFLFTNLVMPKLIVSATNNPRGSTRVVNVSSLSPVFPCGIRWSDINFDKVNKTLPESEQPDYSQQRAWNIKDPESASYLPLEAYNQSKVANVLFSIGGNARFYDKHGILFFAVHPGILRTELGRDAPPEMTAAFEARSKSKPDFFQSQGSGASTSCVAALDPQLTRPVDSPNAENLGVYFVDCQVSDRANPKAVSNVNAKRLWKLSEELVKQKF